MAGPESRQYHDLPVTTIPGVDRVGHIEAILNQHDCGQFRASAQLCDSMMRDDRISGVMKTRVGAQLAADVEVKPADGRAKADSIAKMLKSDGESDDGLWDRIFPKAVQGSLGKWGNYLGFGLAEIIWTTDDVYADPQWQRIAKGMDYKGRASRLTWTPRLKIWHPQYVYWNPGDMRYYVVAQEGAIPLPRIDENPHGDGKWLLWCPFGFQYGWLDALVRCLADRYLMRRWNYRDWARFNERHGQPTIGVQIPTDEDKAQREKFMRKITNLGAEAVVELPQIDGENKYDLKMIEARSRSYDSFQLFKKELDTDIAIAILGQNLTTEGGTDGGSRALGQIQNLVRLDKAKEDARLAQAFREQVLTWWALHNFGSPDLAPRPKYMVEPPDDGLKDATTLKTIGDGIEAHKRAGTPIDVRTILDRANVPMITEEEEAAQAAIKAEEQAAQLEAQANANAATGDQADPAAAKGHGEQPLSGGHRSQFPVPSPSKRYVFQGFPIAVENQAGSLRVWTDNGPNGTVIGSTKMLFDYGYIEGGHLDGDGEDLDVYIGPDPTAVDVHVVHQKKAPDFKRHDENKAFLGFPDAAAAKSAFLAHRNDEGAFGGMSTIPLDEFRRKLEKRKGTGKIRASDLERTREATIAALIRLSERSNQGTEELRAGGRSKRKPEQYPQRLADNAKRLAARALAVDLADVKEEIDAASSFEDLRKRLVVRFSAMDPSRLADVVSKARIMAHLGGRLSALQEV